MSQDDRTNASGPSDHAHERDAIPFHPPAHPAATAGGFEDAVSSGQASVWRVWGRQIGPVWWVLCGHERPGRPDLPAVPSIARVRHPGTDPTDLDGQWHPLTAAHLDMLRAESTDGREEEWEYVPPFLKPMTGAEGATAFEDAYLGGRTSAWEITTEHNTRFLVRLDGEQPGWMRLPAPGSRESWYDHRWTHLAVISGYRGGAPSWGRHPLSVGDRAYLGRSSMNPDDQWITSTVTGVREVPVETLPVAFTCEVCGRAVPESQPRCTTCQLDEETQ